LQVAAIRLQDIILPEDLKRVMARQASAEREKRANITKSEGDREAAENLAAAATTMATAPGALQLRTLQTLDSLGTSAANTVVMAVPVEVMHALQTVPQLLKATQPEQTKQEEPPKLAEGFLLTKPRKAEEPEQAEQQLKA
jgi:regulator of protease activity HflC (stomatin/prohibitin superfamily)